MLILLCHRVYEYIEVKWSRYRPDVAQRLGRGIALLFHDSGTRRGWVVSTTPRPHFTLGKDPVPILQEVGRAPGPVWTGGKSRPYRDTTPDRPVRSQSLYRLNYRPTPGMCRYLVIKELTMWGVAISRNLEVFLSYDIEDFYSFYKQPTTGPCPSQSHQSLILMIIFLILRSFYTINCISFSQPVSSF